jgi:LysR family glycine cleavage system transcriptional activator
MPPLNSLRAFESAARHLSISLAANELNVTPAAISHQVRLLEDHIGLPVFERRGPARIARRLCQPRSGDGCD